LKTEDNPAQDLLDNIDKLTKPINRKEFQETIAGQPMKVVRVTLPPLLTQLDEAIRGSIGIGGSGSLPNERNMLDSDALYRFVMIKTVVEDWARIVKADVHPQDPAATLRAWYVRWNEKARDIPEVKHHRGKTATWVEQIEEKLDPVRIRELPDWCPNCMADAWWNPADKLKYLHPLVIEYKVSAGAELVEKAEAKCRACDEKWGVRQLAYELEQIEKARQEGRDEVTNGLVEDPSVRKRVRDALKAKGEARAIEDPYFDVILYAAANRHAESELGLAEGTTTV
jgi:hypothetical protein